MMDCIHGMHRIIVAQSVFNIHQGLLPPESERPHYRRVALVGKVMCVDQFGKEIKHRRRGHNRGIGFGIALEVTDYPHGLGIVTRSECGNKFKIVEILGNARVFFYVLTCYPGPLPTFDLDEFVDLSEKFAERSADRVAEQSYSFLLDTHLPHVAVILQLSRQFP